MSKGNDGCSIGRCQETEPPLFLLFFSLDVVGLILDLCSKVFEYRRGAEVLDKFRLRLNVFTLVEIPKGDDMETALTPMIRRDRGNPTTFVVRGGVRCWGGTFIPHACADHRRFTHAQ
jgi:hypothetical protein